MGIEWSVTVTRHRDPLAGQRLAVLGSMMREGRRELLLVLPDGSKRLVPEAWTDAEPADAGGDGADGPATLGRVEDLLAAADLAAALLRASVGAQGQAARQSICEEERHAACPTKFVPTGATTATGGDATRDSRRRYGSGDRGRRRADSHDGRRVERERNR